MWTLLVLTCCLFTLKNVPMTGCRLLVEQVSHVQRLCTLPIWVRLPVWDPLLRVTPPLYLILFPAQVFSSSINKAKKKIKNLPITSSFSVNTSGSWPYVSSENNDGGLLEYHVDLWIFLVDRYQ